MEDLERMKEAYSTAGGNESALEDPKVGSIVIDHNRVLSKREVPGLRIEHQETTDGVNVRVTVSEVLKKPVHLCFGMLPQEGRQVIESEFIIKDGAKAEFISHCIFPNAQKIEHLMNSKVIVGKNSGMTYKEEHYHSSKGNVITKPFLRGRILEGGSLFEEFKLVNGMVGELDIDYEVDQEAGSVCDLTTKVYGRDNDRIEIREALHLNGERASGTANSRIFLRDSANASVLGEVEGNAAHARGHVDCQEILYGSNAKASSTPMISVSHPLAKVTHEAAIGRVDKKELETLLARGLSEDQAVNMIVRGLLR